MEECCSVLSCLRGQMCRGNSFIIRPPSIKLHIAAVYTLIKFHLIFSEYERIIYETSKKIWNRVKWEILWMWHVCKWKCLQISFCRFVILFHILIQIFLWNTNSNHFVFHLCCCIFPLLNEPQIIKFLS